MSTNILIKKENETIKPTMINGEPYISINEFAFLTNHSEHSIRMLISKGNKIRKLKTLKLFGTARAIPLSELTEYPFTGAGRDCAFVYHYTNEGKIRQGDFDAEKEKANMQEASKILKAFDK
jgi:hypothetical protein